MEITFHTEKTDGGAPIAGASIRSVPPKPGDPLPWQAVTNAAGDFTADLGFGDYDAVISAPGYQDERRFWRFSSVPPAGFTVRIGLSTLASQFKVSGDSFLNPLTNERRVYSLADCFPAYRFWLDGRIGELERLAEEARDLGFDGWRIFGAGAISQNQVMQLNPWAEPRFVGELPVFAEWLRGQGLIGLWTVNVDMQALQTDVNRRIGNFHATCDAFRNSNMLISAGNEHQKNGFDPNENPNPGPGIIWSRGSATSDLSTPPNGATAAEFHQRRDIPKMFDDSVASATDMQFRQGFGMIWMDEPIGFDEEPSADKRSSDPHVAYKLARVYATYWALAVFHSSAGQRGQLLGPTARACAQAWNRGMIL